MLRHPAAVLALVVLVLNDHVLKAVVPGVVTGKLSDVAGLVVFPLLLAEIMLAGGRLTERVAGRRPGCTRVTVVAWCAALTVVGFTLVKTWAPATAAWAWAWGAAQWVAGAGPLTGRPLLPVAVVRDPTDLLALPAVLVAVAIAARSGRRGAPAAPRAITIRPQRSWAGAGMGLVTAVACMATSQSEPAVYADETATATLTAGTAVIVRHITWSVDMAGSSAGTVALTARVGDGAADDQDGALTPATGVLVSLIPDDTTSGRESPSDVIDWGPTTRVVTAGGCEGWCSGGARLVVRLTSPSKAVDNPKPLRLTAAVRATGLPGPAPSAAGVTVHIDPDTGFDGAPSLSRDVAKGTLHLTPRSDEQVVHLTVKVSKEALPGPLAWPLVLRLFVTVDEVYRGSGEDGQYADVAINGRDEGVGIPIGTPLDLDLLGACDASRQCGIPVKLWLGFSVKGGADVHWTAEARLEAFDGRRLPADAVQVIVQK